MTTLITAAKETILFQEMGKREILKTRLEKFLQTSFISVTDHATWILKKDDLQLAS